MLKEKGRGDGAEARFKPPVSRLALTPHVHAQGTTARGERREEKKAVCVIRQSNGVGWDGCVRVFALNPVFKKVVLCVCVSIHVTRLMWSAAHHDSAPRSPDALRSL